MISSSYFHNIVKGDIVNLQKFLKAVHIFFSKKISRVILFSKAKIISKNRWGIIYLAICFKTVHIFLKDKII